MTDRPATPGDSLDTARREAYDREGCTNGPDEQGNWPCDPQVIYGADEAECQVCGRIAAWKEARHV